MGGKFHLKLNIGSRPIANKYHEGKMKRTLKRELKVPELAVRKADGTSLAWQDCRVCAHGRRGQVELKFLDLDVQACCDVSCLACHKRFTTEDDLSGHGSSPQGVRTCLAELSRRLEVCPSGGWQPAQVCFKLLALSLVTGGVGFPDSR